METPTTSLQNVPFGVCRIQNSWACCQEKPMISRNGLCLQNIWTGTKALSQSPRCFIYRTSGDQMFPVQAVALYPLASARISVSVLVSLAPRDAKVPVDRTPLCFPLVQSAGHLGCGRQEGVPAKEQLKTNHMVKCRKGPQGRRAWTFLEQEEQSPKGRGRWTQASQAQ